MIFWNVVMPARCSLRFVSCGKQKIRKTCGRGDEGKVREGVLRTQYFGEKSKREREKKRKTECMNEDRLILFIRQMFAKGMTRQTSRHLI